MGQDVVPLEQLWGRTESSPMSEVQDERGDEVSRLLAGALRTIEGVRYCWLATAADSGGANLRPMGRIMRDPGEDVWKIRFLTDGRSAKVSEMRRANEVTIVFQDDPDLAFVTLTGRAALRDS